MERSAVAYKANGRLIVAPVICTTTGLGLDVEPSVVPSREPGDISVALSRALESSGRVVPHPGQNKWKDFFRPFWEAAGVRSRSSFMKDAQLVSIEMLGNQFKLTPFRNCGSRGGFEGISDAATCVPAGDLVKAATILMQLFDN